MPDKSDAFIYYSESIEWMLNNISEMVTIIQSDFIRNGKVHPAYIREKMRRAKVDVDALVSIAENKLKEINK